MRLTSITQSIMSAVLLCAYAPTASAHDETKPAEKTASELVNPSSLYIKLINEDEVIIGNETLTLDELEDFLKDTENDLPDQQTILYITDTQFVNQAYKLAFDLERTTQKHIWVTYRP